MSEEMKIALVDGVPTRSFWIEEDDWRLEVGVMGRPPGGGGER